ncbi:MAG: hypothetical protein MUF42_02215 [Cytophagaceae bacterium]|jgi:uncharacterized protein involved in exopolysaccharide biosynthesis|nr:hypothetical protein [Cytophagaceae bacterium]
MNVFDEKVNIGQVGKMYIKHWKLIAYTVTACTLLAIVVSLLITPRYSAKTSFFIPYNISYDLAVENPQFGYDVEADRLLQIINSTQLMDSVTQRFNMIHYYEIDTTEYDWKDVLAEKYRKRIIANRTNVMSIVIMAETHDPLFSAEIVNYILNLSQRMRERMLKTNSELAVESFKKDYVKKKAEVDSLRERILQLRRENNSNPITLVNSQVLLPHASSTSIKPEVAVELEVLSQKHIYEHNRLNDLKGKYENALNVMNRAVPKFYMLDHPTPMYKATFPMIGFNIAIAFLGSLFFMLAGLYVRHVFNTIKQYLSAA